MFGIEDMMIHIPRVSYAGDNWKTMCGRVVHGEVRELRSEENVDCNMCAILWENEAPFYRSCIQRQWERFGCPV
jgi:hypothetical protein